MTEACQKPFFFLSVTQNRGQRPHFILDSELVCFYSPVKLTLYDTSNKQTCCDADIRVVLQTIFVQALNCIFKYLPWYDKCANIIHSITFFHMRMI